MDKKLIVVVDFGNDKLSIVAAYKYNDGRIDILDYKTKQINQLVKNGILENPNYVLTEINDILNVIEEKFNIKIGKYFFGIEPHSLISEIKEVSIQPQSNQIENINALEQKAKSIEVKEGRTILSQKLLSIKYGSNILGKFLFTTLNNKAFSATNKILDNSSSNRKSKYKIVPVTEAEAFLTDKQRQNGTLLINFGANITSFVLYEEGVLKLVGMVPLGGHHITKDIAHRIDTDTILAEHIKKEFGVAATEFVEEDKIYAIPDYKDKHFNIKEISETIEARECEIINLILQEINDQNLKNNYKEIVMLGGGANMKFLAELLENQSDKLVTKAKYDKIPYGNDSLDNAILIAMLRTIDEDCQKTAVEPPKQEDKPSKETKNSKNTPSKNKKPRLWGGVIDMFGESNEKKI